MEIKTKTEYTVERLLRVNTSHMLKNKLRWVIYIGFTVLILAGTIATLVRGVRTGNFGGIALYLLALAGAVGYDTYVIIKSFVSPRKKIRVAPIVGATFKVTFRDDGIIVNAHAKNADSNNAHSYLSLESAIKNGSDLYLYVQKNNAYIVDISSLSDSELLAIKEKLTAMVKSVKWK